MNFKKISFWITTFFCISAISFTILIQDSSTTVKAVVDTELTRNSVFQIFWLDWKVGAAQFESKQSVEMNIKRGHNEILFHIPNDFTMLRFDPISSTGKLIFSKIVIRHHFINLMTWDVSNGFSGWLAKNDISEFRLVNDKLEILSVGEDPYFENSSLNFISFRRKLVDLFLSFLIGIFGNVILNLIFKVYLFLNFSAHKETFKKSINTVIDVKTLSLFLGSIVICSLVGISIYKVLFKTRDVQPEWGDYCGPYIVDHNGLNLSAYRGRAIKVLLDPYIMYRNFPEQIGKGFTTDVLGFRNGLKFNESRLKGMVLGGSSAFSCGATSDQAALHGQLSLRLPKFHFINGGITGHLSGQELGQMIFYTRKYEPQLYIVLDGFNDVYTSLVPFEKSLRQKISFGSNFGILLEIETRLRGHDYETPEWKLSFSTNMPTSEALSRGLEAYRQNIILMTQFAAQSGAKLFHFYQPLASSRLSRERKGIWNERDPQTKLTSTEFNILYNNFHEDMVLGLKKHGIVSVNLNTNSRIQNYPESIFLDAMHLNDLGLNIVAEEIAKVVNGKSKKSL